MGAEEKYFDCLKKFIFASSSALVICNLTDFFCFLRCQMLESVFDIIHTAGSLILSSMSPRLRLTMSVAVMLGVPRW